MSKCRLEPPLAPRNGRTLRAIGITRISTLNQDPKSLDDQKALLTRWVADRYDGPVEWTFIEGQGSGECLQREEVEEANRLVASGEFDLVMLEDLSRHLRRMHAFLFCEDCEDSGTRLIALNDGIDTAGQWRLHAFFAAMKHEQSNKDTSERIKRTLRNRFMQGEVVQTVVYGYIKPPGTKSDRDLQKDPAAEPIYREWFQKLDAGASYSEVADWLNKQGVPTGPYCSSKRWDCAMVSRLTFNPILKGVRLRNRHKSKRVNKTGKYKSVKAERSELLERHCPHLAFFDAEYYDRVTAAVKARNARYKAGRPGEPHPCAGRPKKRTRWPGQHLFCSICGRLLRYGGHGQNDHLLCAGAYEYRCWNGVSVDGPLAAKKLSAAILAVIEKLPDFDSELAARVREEAERLHGAKAGRLAELAQRGAVLERQIANLVAAAREAPASRSLLEEIQRLETEKDALEREQAELRRKPARPVELPSMDAIRRMAREEMTALALESPEFGRFMRQWIERLEVFPCRLIDSGHIVPRARFTVDLSSLIPDAGKLACLADALSRELVVDLFEPPQRVAFRERVLALRAEGKTERQVAKELGITLPAVQRAAALDRLMKEQGLSDPYVPIHEPPTDQSKLRRHLHPRYRFEPLPTPRTAG